MATAATPGTRHSAAPAVMDGGAEVTEPGAPVVGLVTVLMVPGTVFVGTGGWTGDDSAGVVSAGGCVCAGDVATGVVSAGTVGTGVGMTQLSQPGTGVGLGPGVMGTMVTTWLVTIVSPGLQPLSPSPQVCVRGMVQVAVDSGHR